jgi:hypothetical protein
MDNKKTNLTPELKEIYDRVMNTTAPQQAAPTPPPPSIHADIPSPLNTPPAAAPVIQMPTPAEDALSSTPARPVSEIDNKAFSFSGTAPTPPSAPQTDKSSQKKESKISLPILIVIGIVFLVVWGVFWAIIFGFIKR